jgi:hypothetical protein
MNRVMKRILLCLLMLAPATAGADKVWNSGKGTTWDCKKDPAVTINHGKGTYKLKGACTTVNLNGGNLKVTVEAASTVNVNGSKNDVTVDTLGAVSLTGSKNTVTTTAALRGDAPTINNLGKDNVIAQAGGAKPAAPAAPGAPAAPAQPPVVAAPAKGAIDCAKQPSHMLTDNDLDLVYVGACEALSLTGNNIKVKAESVKTLSISGNDNKATVDAAGAIYLTGNTNTVTYKKGISTAKPKLANTGNGNKLSVAK